MKDGKKIWVGLLLLLTPLCGRENPRVAVHLHFQATGFAPAWQLAAATGIGGGVLVRLTPFLLGGIQFQSGRTRQAFAVIGGEEFVDIRVRQWLVTTQIPLWQSAGGFAAAVTGGGGILRLIRSAHTVSLGGAGSVHISRTERHYFAYQGGAALWHPIRGRLGATLSLILQGVFADQMRMNRTIEGGLRFEIH